MNFKNNTEVVLADKQHLREDPLSGEVGREQEYLLRWPQRPLIFNFISEWPVTNTSATAVKVISVTMSIPV